MKTWKKWVSRGDNLFLNNIKKMLKSIFFLGGLYSFYNQHPIKLRKTKWNDRMFEEFLFEEKNVFQWEKQRNTYECIDMCERDKSLQLCPTLCHPIDCSPPGSSVHGILQVRILEWVAVPSSRVSSDPGTKPSSLSLALAGRFFTTSMTWEVPILTYLSEKISKETRMSLNISSQQGNLFWENTSIQFSLGNFLRKIWAVQITQLNIIHSQDINIIIINGQVSACFVGGASSEEPTCRRHKRPGFNPWVGKIPWRRAWWPTPVFLPGESHGQRSLVVYSP